VDFAFFVPFVFAITIVAASRVGRAAMREGRFAIETTLDLVGSVETLDDTDQSSVDQDGSCIEIMRGSAFLVAASPSIDAQTAEAR
jgi:hypothetical protein